MRAVQRLDFQRRFNLSSDLQHTAAGQVTTHSRLNDHARVGLAPRLHASTAFSSRKPTSDMALYPCRCLEFPLRPLHGTMQHVPLVVSHEPLDFSRRQRLTLHFEECTSHTLACVPSVAPLQ
jgi:hypothetical protein